LLLRKDKNQPFAGILVFLVAAPSAEMEGSRACLRFTGRSILNVWLAAPSSKLHWVMIGE
jgi:hypothetical protein